MSNLSNAYGFKCSKCGGKNSDFSVMTDIYGEKYFSMICSDCGSEVEINDVVKLAFRIILKCYAINYGRVIYLSQHSKKSRVRKKNFNRIKRKMIKDLINSFKEIQDDQL